LLNLNPQAVAEEIVDPAVYNRGVVGICASENPGSATDPTRFVNVGHCDDSSIGCWLDKNSVDSAITVANAGKKDATLEELNEVQESYLDLQTSILPNDQINGIFAEFVSGLKNARTKEEVNVFIELADATLPKVFQNYQKARLIMIKGEFYSIVARKFKGVVEVEDPGETPAEETPEETLEEVAEDNYFLKIGNSPINKDEDVYGLYKGEEFQDVYIEVRTSNRHFVYGFKEKILGGISASSVGYFDCRESKCVFEIQDNYEAKDISDVAKEALKFLEENPETDVFDFPNENTVFPIY
jgi:hypothetical protein